MASPVTYVYQSEIYLHSAVVSCLPRGLTLHAEQAREHPRDLVSLKLGQYHCFNTGDCPGMLRLALAVLPHAAEVPYVHGMAAFGYEQRPPPREAAADARLVVSSGLGLGGRRGPTTNLASRAGFGSSLLA